MSGVVLAVSLLVLLTVACGAFALYMWWTR
jgi:hypothetical protein